MLKKSLTMITLLCAMVPMVAHAASWSLATRVSTVGGNITSRNTAAAQTSANGTVFKTYTTHASIPVTITADSGYAISAVSVNGSAVSPVPASPYTVSPAVGLANYPTKGSQAVVVSFSAQTVLVPVTIEAGAGGTVTPAGTFKVKPGSDASVTFAPTAGNTFAGVTGVTPTSMTNVLDINGNPTGAVKVSFTAPSSAVTVHGNFSIGLAVTASASATTVAPNATVNLTAAATTTGSAPTYAWTQTGGPSLAWTATGASVTTPALPTDGAVYTFQVTATNNIGSKSASVCVVVTTAAPPTLDQQVMNQCINCHNQVRVGFGAPQSQYSSVNIVYVNWAGSSNNVNACWTCHVNANVGGHPGDLSLGPVAGHDDNSLACNKCHNDAAANTDAHNKLAAGTTGCIDCHAHPQNAGTLYVQDNSGVRVITTEFGKWSHHVDNTVTLDNAHCAACHLEGKVSNGKIVVDHTKHMADNKTHLRNADTDADMVWDPAAPSFSTMDNFCLSCHDSDGATSAGSQAIQAYINTNGKAAQGKIASATNPFGDSITNQYDLMQRPGVVNAKDQFDTANNSHHAVLGKRYSGRSRITKGGTIADATFTANSSANLPGARTTIFDAGKFNANYITLADSTGEADSLGTLDGRNGGTKLGDDSTLHCGDCHTVGQYRASDVNNATGSFNKAVIGAHGSQNEYLLRNSVGTDARHQGIPQTATKGLLLDATTPLLICYNCHVVAKYGTGAHVGEQVSENNCNMATNTNTVNTTGTARLGSQYTKTIGTLVAGASSGADFSNIYGIQCNNCHNSGISAGNIFGGIHGSKDATYTDGAGNTTKHMRFLPGLGNVMYVPGTRGGIIGGHDAPFVNYSSKWVKSSITGQNVKFVGTYTYKTGGVTSDLNWEEKARIPVGDGVTSWSHNPGAAGCYTITAGADEPNNAESNGVLGGPAASKGLTAPDGTELFGNWGGCDDHSQQAGASVRQPRSGNTSIRPVTY